MRTLLFKTSVLTEPDVVVARQGARKISELLGLDVQDQTRIATAISELLRNACNQPGPSEVIFALESEPPELIVEIDTAGREDFLGDVQGALSMVDELQVDAPCAACDQRPTSPLPAA